MVEKAKKSAKEEKKKVDVDNNQKSASPVKEVAQKPKKTDQPKLIPEVNIGMVGHVDHGKTSLNQAVTGKWTSTHSEEVKRGITIRLGYSDVTFYKCTKCNLYGKTEKCITCFSECSPERTASFVDAPGHETLMATVLAGTSIMDGAILVIAANENCPQPQTREHLTALDISGIKQIIIVQNKIDLVDQEKALKNYQQIKDFVKGTVAENAPIIPVSARHLINIDTLIEAIETYIKTPQRDITKPAKMLVARSFDINKPGQPIDKLIGGVVGGSLVQGELKQGDEIEIRPGIKIKDKFQPVKSKIIGLQKANMNLDKAGSGGLLAVSTLLDPSLTKADSLSGQVLGHPDKLPPVLEEITIKSNILKRVIGTKEELEVEPIKLGEILMLTIGTTKTVGSVTLAGKQTKVKLKLPVCADKGDRLAISRQVAGRWRLIGWGEIV